MRSSPSSSEPTASPEAGSPSSVAVAVAAAAVGGLFSGSGSGAGGGAAGPPEPPPPQAASVAARVASERPRTVPCPFWTRETFVTWNLSARSSGRSWLAAAECVVTSLFMVLTPSYEVGWHDGSVPTIGD